MDGQHAPAGWYPVGDGERYWNGLAWTDQVRAPGTGPAAPASDGHGPGHHSFAPPASQSDRPRPEVDLTQPMPHPADRPRYTYGVPSTPAPPPSMPSTPAYGYAPPMVGGLVQTPYGYVAPKSPAISVLASFFLPGLGSMLNGDVGKGVAILIGYFVSWLLVIVLVGLVGVFGFWVWGMVDAYQGARLWNARHGIYS